SVALGRSLSLSGRAHPGSRADVRVQCRADTRHESGNRRLFEKDGRAALDTARLLWQRQIEEVAEFLRVVGNRRPPKALFTASDQLTRRGGAYLSGSSASSARSGLRPNREWEKP